MFMWGVVRQQNEGGKEWAGAGAQECDWYKSLDFKAQRLLPKLVEKSLHWHPIRWAV